VKRNSADTLYRLPDTRRLGGPVEGECILLSVPLEIEHLAPYRELPVPQQRNHPEHTSPGWGRPSDLERKPRAHRAHARTSAAQSIQQNSSVWPSGIGTRCAAQQRKEVGRRLVVLMDADRRSGYSRRRARTVGGAAMVYRLGKVVDNCVEGSTRSTGRDGQAAGNRNSHPQQWIGSTTSIASATYRWFT
jgi:hypothetical protein